MEKHDHMDILKSIEQEMDNDIHPFLKKILDNIKPIGLAVGGIIAVVAIYAGINAYQKKEHAKAVSELGAIMMLGNADDRIARLEAFAQSGPADMRPAVELELARTYLVHEKFDQAAAAWRKVGQTQGLRSLAGLGEAKALMLAGKYEAATTLLQELKKDAPEEFIPAISANLAFAAEKSGQTTLAIDEYEDLKAKDARNEEFLNYKIRTLGKS